MHQCDKNIKAKRTYQQANHAYRKKLQETGQSLICFTKVKVRVKEKVKHNTAANAKAIRQQIGNADIGEQHKKSHIVANAANTYATVQNKSSQFFLYPLHAKENDTVCTKERKAALKSLPFLMETSPVLRFV